MALTNKERALIGRMGAHAQHAKHSTEQTTIAGRRAFLERFEREVDPDGTLPEDERRDRARHALKRHMTELALRSARARARGTKRAA